MRPNWFIGLPAPLGAAFLARLPRPPQGVRLFHPDDLHLTLAFLGGVAEAAARAAWDTVAGHAWAPVDARLDRVVPMGDPRRPSALSATLAHGHDAVVALITALRDPALAAAGARPDPRPPRPHLTLARPGRHADGRTRRAGVAWAAGLDVAGTPVRLDRLALYTWSDDRRARQFQVVAEAPAPGIPG